MFPKTRALGAKKGAERRRKDGVKDKKQVRIASGHPKKMEPAENRGQLQICGHESIGTGAVGHNIVDALTGWGFQLEKYCGLFT